jgi:hypothetical protein
MCLDYFIVHIRAWTKTGFPEMEFYFMLVSSQIFTEKLHRLQMRLHQEKILCLNGLSIRAIS